MMGYVVRGTYTIMRKRIFKRMRRQLIRAGRDMERLGYVPWWRAAKLTGIKGRIKNSNSRKFSAVYNVKKILKSAERSISARTKKGTAHETAILQYA